MDEEEKSFVDKYFATDTLLDRPEKPIRNNSLTM